MASAGNNKPSQKITLICNKVILNIKLLIESVISTIKTFKKFLVRHKALLECIAALCGIIGISASQFDYNLEIPGMSVIQPIELEKGESLDSNIVITCGYGLRALALSPIDQIYLEGVDVPEGLDVSIRPKTGHLMSDSRISIQVYDNASEGDKRFRLRAIDAFGRKREREINLKILDTKYFQLFSNSYHIILQQNSTITVPIHAIRNQDYLKKITLDAFGLPSEINATFNPASLLPDEALSNLMLEVKPEAMIGIYNFSVVGTGDDNKTTCFNISLEIVPERSFMISVAPCGITVPKGESSVSVLLELIGINNYTGKVDLMILNYPMGINLNLPDNAANLSVQSPKDQSVLKISASDEAIPGKWYNVTINGKGEDGYSKNCTITVIIENNEVASFEIIPEFANVLLLPNNEKTLNIEIKGKNEYEGTISLKTNDMPYGLSLSFSIPEVKISKNNSIGHSQLTIKANSELKNELNFDLNVIGSDRSDNEDNCIIKISIRPERQNETPTIRRFSKNTDPVYSGDKVVFSVEADDPDNDLLKFRFLLDNNVSRNWSYDPGWETSLEAGEHELGAQIIDGLHAGLDGFDNDASMNIIVQPYISPQFIDPQPAVENRTPSIEKLSSNGDNVYSESPIKFTTNAKDPDNDPIEFKFLLNGNEVQNWSLLNTWEDSLEEGEHKITVQIRDALHAAEDSYDDIETMTYSNLIPISPGDFLKATQSMDLNLDAIPVNSQPSVTPRCWYKTPDDLDSAKYKLEYQIIRPGRADTSKHLYTISLDFDSSSNPTNVAFMVDSNPKDEMEPEILKEAIECLHNL